MLSKIKRFLKSQLLSYTFNGFLLIFSIKPAEIVSFLFKKSFYMLDSFAFQLIIAIIAVFGIIYTNRRGMKNDFKKWQEEEKLSKPQTQEYNNKKAVDSIFRNTINKIDDIDLQMLMRSGNFFNDTFYNRWHIIEYQNTIYTTDNTLYKVVCTAPKNSNVKIRFEIKSDDNIDISKCIIYINDLSNDKNKFVSNSMSDIFIEINSEREFSFKFEYRGKSSGKIEIKISSLNWKLIS